MSDPIISSDIGVKVGEFDEAAASRPQHPDRHVRIGFIGTGWWATTNHIPMLNARKDVVLASACGLDEQVLHRVQDDFGFGHITADYHELLRQDLDGVIVASPHPLHAEHAIAALEAGCHVMVEKPMATTIEQAIALIQKAEQTGRIVTVSYGWHHRPLCIKAKRLMDQNLIGSIEHVVCHMGSPEKNLFAGISFDYTDTAYVAPDIGTYADANKSQGGYGQGQLSHAVGLMFWLTGLRAEQVFAHMSNVDSKVDMYDALSVRFTNGAIGTVAGAASVPGGARFQLDLRIFGSEGVLNLDIDRERLDVYRHDGKVETVDLQRDEGAYACDGPPHEFVELILGLTDTISSPIEIGLRSVELIDAAYRSAQSNLSIRIDG